MWSPYYKYYQIRKDNRYSELIKTEIVKSIILDDKTIVPKGNLMFRNRKGLPWISITLIRTENGSYAVDKNTDFKEVNLIEVITSRRPETNEDWYLKMMRTVSKKLNWEIILEIDDDENEEIKIKNGS